MVVDMNVACHEGNASAPSVMMRAIVARFLRTGRNAAEVSSIVRIAPAERVGIAILSNRRFGRDVPFHAGTVRLSAMTACYSGGLSNRVDLLEPGDD